MATDSNEVTLFDYKGNNVRTVMIDGEPWFVAKDVCEVLGLVNPDGFIRKVPINQKGLYPMQTPGGIQRLSIVSEPGLYRLIMRSDKPEAEPFMAWLTEEVLPAIRKTGSYGTPKASIEELISNPDLVIAYAQQVKQLQVERDAAMEQCGKFAELAGEANAERAIAISQRDNANKERAIAQSERELAEDVAYRACDARDEAIRTKSEIGRRREATAMATASNAVQKYQKLADRVGLSENYRTVMAIPGLTIVIGEELWLVAKDVAELLEYPNTNRAISYYCHRVQKLHPIIDTMGREQDICIINETDLYRLIAHSPQCQKQ